MHRRQIEIYSNLEAYVCDDNKSNFFKWKENIFFVKFFRKPVSKCVALFRMHCLPARKRRKVSLNIGSLQWFCLLFSANERTAVGISLRAAFYLFVVARVGNIFPQFCEASNSFARVDQLQSEQIFHYKHFCKITSAQFIFKKTCFGSFLSCILFSFFFLWAFGLWNKCEVVPMLILSLRSDIQVQAFQKDAIKF